MLLTEQSNFYQVEERYFDEVAQASEGQIFFHDTFEIINGPWDSNPKFTQYQSEEGEKNLFQTGRTNWQNNFRCIINWSL